MHIGGLHEVELGIFNQRGKREIFAEDLMIFAPGGWNFPLSFFFSLIKNHSLKLIPWGQPFHYKYLFLFNCSIYVL